MRARGAAMTLAALLLLTAVPSCTDGDGAEVEATGDAVLIAVAGRELVAISLRAGEGEQVLVDDLGEGDTPGAARGVCVLPDGSRRVLVAERGRPDGGPPGWSLFALDGDRVGEFSAERVHRLVGPGASGVPTGCAFLGDGRLLTADHGDGVGASGRLIVWYPPFDVAPVRHCVVAEGIAGAQALHVGRADAVFVASSAAPTAGVLRLGELPIEGEECGAPVAADVFLPPDEHLPAADALAGAADGGLYVASAAAGRVVQYDRLGRYVRTVLQPPGARTPVALAHGPGESLLYADAAAGRVGRVVFRSEAPQAPVVVAEDLDEPGGLAVLVIPS